MITVRGNAKILWKPDYTLVFTSPDGLSLDANSTHTLIATLTNTADGSPVANRFIRLSTNPTPRNGDGAQFRTNAEGVVTFTISNGSVESVVYLAEVIPVPPTTEPTVTQSLTIDWGTPSGTCNSDISNSDGVIPVGTDPVEGAGYHVLWTSQPSGVTNAQGLYRIIEGFDPPTFDVDSDNVEIVIVEELNFEETVEELTPAYEALLAEVQAGACV